MSLFSSESNRSGKPPSPRFTLPPASPPQARHRSGYSRLASISANSLANIPLEERDESTARLEGITLEPGLAANDMRPTTRAANDLDPEFHDFSEVSAFGARSPPDRYTPLSSRSLNSDASSANLLKHPLSYHKAKNSNLDSGVSLKSYKSYAEFSPREDCPSARPLWNSRGHYLSITLLVLSIFSTVFSGFYLAIALRRPRYGHFIYDEGHLSFSTATTLFALFAKLIEVSFITVFVAFIGQVVSRRAFMRSQGRGITLAEISMRAWVMQPGTILTHLQGVKYALVTVLGAFALVAALVAVLYTTAASALVSPQLSFGSYATYPMKGLVKSAYGNMTYIESLCQTPVTFDSSFGAATCLGIEVAAQSFHNFQTYMSNWNNFQQHNMGSDDLKTRPQGFALLDDNITVTGPWIEISDMNGISTQAKRLLNNATLAMPHASVVGATRDPVNRILQPKLLDGFGAFELEAATPAPYVNVLCANMSEDELRPMIYSGFPGAEKPFNTSAWPHQSPLYKEKEWSNATTVDDVFLFGPRHGGRRPPMFPKLPIDYNTVLSGTGPPPLSFDAVYLLTKGGPEVDGAYSMCQLRSGLTSRCSTRYKATSSGSQLEADCENLQNEYEFSKYDSGPSSEESQPNSDWAMLAYTWAEAISLGSGLTDADASIARILSQMIPKTSIALNQTLPSLAEALAVLSDSTLLMASQGTSFNYHSNTARDESSTPGDEYQTFDAALRSQQYASGAKSGYQNAFYIPLVLLFLGNILALGWMIIHRGLVTDFCDSANLFALAINSPPSHRFSGSCGGGPDGQQYRARWFINVEGDHIFLENTAQGPLEDPNAPADNRNLDGSDIRRTASPVAQAYSKLSRRTSYL